MTDLTRSALVVASYEYDDPKLRRLRAPARDAEELARVLRDPEIGDFEVEVSVNEPEHVVRRRLAMFFQNRGLDDLLLLHLSCHGLKDEDGHLYFATADTEVGHLDATAIPADFVNRQMTRSRSRRVVLLLDCCYSGAFARGMLSRAGDRVDIGERFDGRGRIVLTASSAMEYSFEGDEVSGSANPSVFTSAVVEGLESGRADRDRDGLISIDELYDYAYDKVRTVTPSQTPGKWTFDVQGELYLARSALGPSLGPIGLPTELRSALENPLAHVRVGAVEALAALLRGSDAALAAAARKALEDLTEDDSRRVMDAAARVLSEPSVPVGVPSPASSGPPIDAGQEPTAHGRAARSKPLSRQVGPRSVGFAFVGAVAAFAAYLLTVDGKGNSVLLGSLFNDEDQWLNFSPLEWAGVCLGAFGVTLAALRGRIQAQLAAGLLFGLGSMTLAAAFAMGLYFAELDLGEAALGIGGIALLVAGGTSLRAARLPVQRAPVVEALAIGLGLAGAALWVWATYLHYRPGVTITGAVNDATQYPGGAVYGVRAAVLMAVVAAATAAALLSLRRLVVTAAGLLLGVGALMLLHFAGVVFAPLFWNRAAGWLGWSGFVGMLGGALAAGGGGYVLRRGQEPAPGAPNSRMQLGLIELARSVRRARSTG